MWKKIYVPFIEAAKMYQPLRTTWVVKRVHEARLRKPGRFASLRKKHFIYTPVERPPNPKEPTLLNVLLRKYVEDLGQPGEVASIKADDARFLLLSKAAVYASTENIDKFGKSSSDAISYSSRYALSTINMLSKFVLYIRMNKEQPWTLEHTHIRSAFRILNVTVPENSIIMPKNALTGPDLTLESKEFYIHVLINGREKVPVRCRIIHWATNPKERTALPIDDKSTPELLFDEDEEIVKNRSTSRYSVVSPSNHSSSQTI